MLYFKVVVYPAGPMSGEWLEGERIAHVVTDLSDVEIEAAAALVVRRLHTDGWRISHVLEARPTATSARNRGDGPLTRLVHEASDTGYAFAVESTGAATPVARFDPQSSPASIAPRSDRGEETQQAG